jgi:membrane-bound serine protease (ClpP class)
MRDIIQDMVNSTVPVVVYVAPSGARAASAGVFLTIAAHVAVMAPNTNIGAAHPVSLGETDTTDATMEEKVLNDAVAYIKSLAESHNRNVEWAEQAVRESVSATEQEALDLNVVDMVVPDLNTLIRELDGREVTMLEGNVVTIDTTGATVRYFDMNWAEKFLYAIANPDIAYILLSVASLGIFAEIFNPGLIFPGVIGGICGLLSFYALGMLPVNLTGILLIVLAFGFFVAEALTTSFGLLLAGGIISMIIGSLILFKGGGPDMHVNPGLIAAVVVLFAGFFGFVVERVVRVHRKRASTGKEELVGHSAVARTPLTPSGQVTFRGERWLAVSESGNIDAGEAVVITRVDGLTLYVSLPSGKS